MTQVFEVCDDALNKVTEVSVNCEPEINFYVFLEGGVLRKVAKKGETKPPRTVFVNGRPAIYSTKHGVYILYEDH